ncbi:hypothetical protein Pcinc_003613 [Petrolisthes cinctipes]|uniref:Histone-lysine N-methyltransferase NSD2 n=1 Tax=Petrolisthes cinctipes TaxID=88211 RepID=A0AAE1L2C6_PETCI|nr:hypothetical protein Pcinc_003613 [Petrolisthes cinctipes]
MDDVSHEYDMGYGNLYLPSEVHGALASMSQGSNVIDNAHGTIKPDEEDEDNRCEERHVGSWLDRSGTSGVVQEYIEEDVGMAWLQDTDNSESVSQCTACSDEENSINVKEEEMEEKTVADGDKIRFDTKFSGTEYDSTTEEEIKYNVDEEPKYRIDDVNYDADTKLAVEQEKRKDSDANDAWLESESCLGNQIIRQKEKQLWDSSNDEGISPDDQWHSSSEETSSAENDEAIAKVRNTVSAKSAAIPNNFSEPVLTKPILSFDEYGNLTTTYHKSEVSTAEISLPEVENMQKKTRSTRITRQSNMQVSPKISHYPKETLKSPCNGDIKTNKQKSKPVCDSGENLVVTDQELKQAFKEEFMTAATSRYGRTRKRKVEDGFFFGTLNFNELRKITSSSPKKGKGSSSKHSSPDQKTNCAAKDVRQLQGIENISGRLSQNGFNEAESGIASGAVQMWDTKEADMLVQNESNKDVAAGVDCRSTLDNIYHEAESATVKTSTTPLLNASEKNAIKIEATAESLGLVDNTKERSSPVSEKIRSEERRDVDKLQSRRYRKHKRSNYRKRGLRSRTDTEDYKARVPVRYNTITTSDRMLRGRSDVDKIKQALRDAEVSRAVRRQNRARRSIDQSVSEPSVSADSQDLQVEDQAITDPPEKSEFSNESKDTENEMSSITKSGRVIHKPQLMDISDEDKRQKLHWEQMKQSKAMLNSSLEEEVSVSSMALSTLEKEHPCEYLVGDLVWVHIRGSPLWPSMISYDPFLGEYSRLSLSQSWQKIRATRVYHVQFFSDNAMTHWISPGNVLPFEGFDKLKEYLLEQKSKMKEMKKYKRVHIESLLRTLPHTKNVISGQKHERWLKAIEEATQASAMDRYERIQKYALENIEAQNTAQQHMDNRMSSLHRKTVKLKHIPQEIVSEKKKRGRPRKHQIEEKHSVLKSLKTNGESTDGEFSGFDDSSNERKEYNLDSKLSKEGDFEVYVQRHLDRFMEDNPSLTEGTARNRLRWRWKRLSNAQASRYKSMYSQSNTLKRKINSGSEREGESLEDEEEVSTKRQRTEEGLEGGRGVYRVVRNEKVCYRCEGVSVKAGADMIRCKGLCCGVFHLSCLGLATQPKRDFKCEECLTGLHPCFVCKSSIGATQRCTVPFCGKFYHEQCTLQWPQMFRQRQQEKFVCPRHICHMCAATADDIGDPVARNPPFTRCLRCPTTYHIGEDCLAAGTEEVSQNHHICTKHLQLPKNMSHHVNVNWCFCCSKGGSLLLCDQCPAAFHADCLEITAPEGGYVCEDCENGKFPIYGDIVWVKLGLYRWWPGQVLHPRFIPDNIENLPHQQGMFCVHFFGSNDYYWITRGRTFLYQEGDKGSKAQSSKTIEMQFSRALDEALEAYRAHRTRISQRDRRWSEKGNLKPPPYVRIDTNRPVGNVRLNKLDLAAVNRCDCDPNSEKPCGSDEVCLNRMLMFECVREVCGAGDRCGNQRFQKKQYPNICCFKTEGRGFGLKSLEDIKKGDFVIEYVGELIDDEEFRRRIEEMHEVKEENFYFLTIDKDIMIDAGPKGNLARFMNHSCQPNCETQKWTVGGDTRVGLFASKDIPAGCELTFNYNLQCVGTEKKRCCCGAPNCSGFIGVKVQKSEVSGPKREKLGKQRRRRRRREVKLSEDECFRCGTPGDLILCDVSSCPKGYHLECLGLEKLPKGKWSCPWHHCDECGQHCPRSNCCDYCPNSFCRQHINGNLHLVPDIGNLCLDHNEDDLETLRGQMKTPAVTERTIHNQKKLSLSYSSKVNGIIDSHSSLDTMDSLGNDTHQASDQKSVEKATDVCVTRELQYNTSLHSLENGTENIPPEACSEKDVSSQSPAAKVEADVSLINSMGEKERGKRGQCRRSTLFSAHRKGSSKNKAKHVNEA